MVKVNGGLKVLVFLACCIQCSYGEFEMKDFRSEEIPKEQRVNVQERTDSLFGILDHWEESISILVLGICLFCIECLVLFLISRRYRCGQENSVGNLTVNTPQFTHFSYRYLKHTVFVV